MNSPDLSIVIRSKNDAKLIAKTLEGIARQDYSGRVRRIHIDSGSTDGTCDIIERSNPDVFVRIRAEDYIPGRVLNTGMNLASEDWVVFLNSDAEPADENWLSGLMKSALSSEHVGAVFGRQVPRPDCDAVFAHDYERCFGPNRESVNWPDFFSMVSSAVNRAAWQQQPFREDLRYAEDVEWAARLKEHGWNVVYAAESKAIHSHNYTFGEAKKRWFGDSFAYAATAPESAFKRGYFSLVLLGSVRESVRDLVYCMRTGRLLEWPHAVAIRVAQRLGRREGLRAGRRHYARADRREPPTLKGRTSNG